MTETIISEYNLIPFFKKEGTCEFFPFPTNLLLDRHPLKLILFERLKSVHLQLCKKEQPMKNINPTTTASWQKLQDLANEGTINLASAFKQDPARAKQMSLQVGDILLDYSKNLISPQIMEALIALANEACLEENRNSMFSGEKINATEGRAVLHTALRNSSTSGIKVDGQDVMPGVHQVLDQMSAFCAQVHSGAWLGYSGQTITTIVNIGIGGSDLGPMMVYEALTPYHTSGIKVHFVSNVDGSHIEDTLALIDPERTLFVIASKSFTTIETMTNAHSARNWFLQKGREEDIAKHFVAVSTNEKLVTAFGIDVKNMFVFWDWVGGRYSLASAIGLSIMLGVGDQHFRDLLSGMATMDDHFKSADLSENMPVILALLGIWYGNFLGAETEAILPYDQHLQHLPAYLQQASMESNGKTVDRNGEPIDYQTGAILWGGAGTNSQHSFFQLLHQGSQLIPADFIVCKHPSHDRQDHQQILLANCLAQTEALMLGRSRAAVVKELEEKGVVQSEIDMLSPYKVFAGNRPSNTLLLKQLTPTNLGMLISLYEHKIFVQGAIWNVYSFDQFGVELGKILANELLPSLQGTGDKVHDPSTNNLINIIRSL